MNLSTRQSGHFRDQTRLSKYGNARLRTVFWLAAQSAVRMRENSPRRKFDDYVRRDPLNSRPASQGLYRGRRQAGADRLQTSQERD